MADRYDDRGEWYRGERPYGQGGRDFVERPGDETRSWFNHAEPARGREADRGREYRPRGEQRWGDDPYRTERWRESDHRWDRRPEHGWGGSAGAARAFGGADYGRIDSDRDDLGPYPYRGETELRYGGVDRVRSDREPQRTFVGRGPKSYKRADARLYEDVNDRLTEAPEIDATAIEVTVNNGEVTLSGNVSDRQQKRRAEELAERVFGVREIRNRLRISRREEGREAEQRAISR